MNIGLGIGIPFTRSSLWASIFTPSALFLDGSTQGVWYDPSDNTTLFQDAAATIPVTAVEQPVGRILDKSGKGNHAFNPSGNSANFPVLSARVNLLTKTEDISTADWIKLGTSAPNADTLLELAVSGLHRGYQSKNVPATKCCLYAEFYPAGRSSCSLSLYDASGGTTRAGAVFSIDGAGSIISGSSDLNKISLLPDGWYGCYIESTSAFSGGNTDAYIGATNGAAQSYTGDATKGVRVRKVDFRPIGTGVNLPAYQRVNTATDYDTVGFKPYLRFNGVNQWLQTNSIDFSYSDKMFVSAGVRKLSDAIGVHAELSNNANGNNGSFNLISGNNVGASDYDSLGRGTAAAATNQIAYAAPFAAPDTSVISASHDIAGSLSTIRRNSVAGTSATGSKGTGNFGNYPLYIGARAGSSLWFNGRLYQLVIAAGSEIRVAEEDSDLFLSESGDFITAETTVAVIQSAIEQTEAFVNRKTSAF